MKIKPIFTTTVAKDTYNADGSLWMPKGSIVAFCSCFDTKKLGKFSVIAPNPVHLFIANVDQLIEQIKEETRQINLCDKIIVFSKLVNGVNKYTTEELLKLDPNATQQRKLDEEKLYKLLTLSASCLVSLITSVEAFVNQELPKDLQYTKTNKDGSSKTLDKSEIEISIRLEDKIALLAKALGVSGYKQQHFWQQFKKIKSLRDNLVHIKTKGSEMVNRNDALYLDLFELEYSEARNSIVALMNYFIKDYIQN